MTRLLTAMLLVAVLALAACGDDDDDGEVTATSSSGSGTTATITVASDAPTTSTNAASPEATATSGQTEVPAATATSGSSASPSPEATGSVPAGSRDDDDDDDHDDHDDLDDDDDQRIHEALPSLADMPAGWVVSDDDDDDDDAVEDDDAENLCGAEPFDDIFDDVPNADVEYQGGDAGPFFLQASAYLGEQDAVATMERLRTALSCETWTQTDDDDGSELVWTFADSTIEGIGDDLFARALNVESGGFVMSGDLVMVREAGFIIVSLHFGLGGVDSGVTASALQLTAERVGQLEGFE
jgi:hypothetical protein